MLLPSLSPGVEEVTLARWLKKEGDRFEKGEVIAEIETDKATIEFEAEDEGVIEAILIPAGTQGVKVNQPIALIHGEAEHRDAIESVQRSQNSRSAPAAAAQASPPQLVHPTKPVALPMSASGEKANERVFASPLARRLAREAEIDLSRLVGSGPGGRVLRLDVERTKADIDIGNVSPPAMAAGRYRESALSLTRKVIARRLTESKQTVPHFYLTIDCNLDRLLALRAEINARRGDAKVSVNDSIVRAVALTLMKAPAANASFTETAIRLYDDVDVALAVATPSGVITPVIRQADRKSLLAISAEVKALVGRAREGKLLPEEYRGGGFTVSNLGMYGIRAFAAIVDPPQACILAVGAGEPRVVVKDGAPTVATMMTNTLSVDHRVVDGTVGAEFLSAYKELIEDPLALLL
jgi:pyruvate dehydrogenase E2 component (dihydrolipoamide acetyltransferase)